MDDKTRTLIVKMLKEDRPTPEIAKAAGVSAPTVVRLAAKEGISRRPGRPNKTSPETDRLREEARILADQDLSLEEIAVQIGRSPKSVRNYLTEQDQDQGGTRLGRRSK